MTEPGKNAPGLVGFPTPDNAADVASYLLFLFNDETLAQWLLGALEPMVYEQNWYKSGDLEPEEASELFRLIIQQGPYNLLPVEDVEAPFWDDTNGDDSSDTAPPDEQDWFGFWDGETFTESLAYHTVTAFLATGFGVGAAIKFITPLRQFRLTLKKNPHGAKLLMLLDSNIFQLVDLFSASDEVEYVDVISPGSELLLVNSGEHNPDATPDENGNYLVTIIKSQLSVAATLPPFTRYDTDCGCVQTTTDGGATWVDTPSADPRHGLQFLKPPLTGSDIPCNASANMVKWLKDFIDALVSALAVASTAFQLANLALQFFELLFGEAGLLVDLLLEIGAEGLFLGESALDAAFDSSVYDELLCIFLCACDAGGTISASSFQVVLDQIDASSINATAKIVLFLILNAQGEIGLSNAGAIGSETGDCSGCPSCDWVVEYDFTTGRTFGFISFISGGTVRGSFVGDHWVATGIPTELVMLLFKQMPGVHFTGWSYYGLSFHGSGIGNLIETWDMTVFANPPTLTSKGSGALPVSTSLGWNSIGFTAFTATQGWAMQANCDSNGSGYFEVYKIRMAGTGTPPADGTPVASLT